jgi:hypothetical protein
VIDRFADGEAGPTYVHLAVTAMEFYAGRGILVELTPEEVEYRCILARDRDSRGSLTGLSGNS